MTSAGSAVVTECEYEAYSVAASKAISKSSAKTTTTISDYHIVPDAEVTAVTPKSASTVISSSKAACMPPTSEIVDPSTALAPAVGSEYESSKLRSWSTNVASSACLPHQPQVTFTSMCKTVSEIADAFRATCITLLKVDVEVTSTCA